MALKDNIVAYWKLDESSGNAADSVASNTLTNNNSVAYNAAKINNGANFGTANTNKTLSSTTNSGTGHQNMSFSCWVKMNTEIASGTQGFFNIRTNTSNNWIDWSIQYEYNGGTRRIGFNRSRPGVADNFTYGTQTMGTTDFYHLVLTYDTATLRGYINGTEVNNLSTSGVGTGGASTINIGGYSTSSNRSNTTIDEFGIWTRTLSAAEVTSLYNSGAGLSYRDIVPLTFKSATVNAASVPATQTNFPSYVDLSRLGITTLAEAQSVRVYADSAKTTEWAREIVSATEMHVKVPSLTSTVSMYVDWDGVRADYAVTDTYGRNAVWSDYKYVYHLDSLTVDSTGNGNTLVNSGTVTNATGKLNGNGADTGSANTTKTLNNVIQPIVFTSNSTRSYWVNFTTLPVGAASVAINNMFTYASSNFRRYAIRYQGTNGFGYELVTAGEVWSGDTVSASTWNYIVSVYDGTNIKMYLNGATEIQTQAHSFPTQFGASEATKRVCLFGVDGSGQMSGKIDEARIKQSTTSANWMTTEYNNQSAESTFWGTWSTVGGGATFTPKVQWLT